MLPPSRYPELIQALAEYLTQESIAYEPDIDWNHYSDTIANGDPPKGRIYLTNFLPTNQIQTDFRATDFNLAIELGIADLDINSTYAKAHAWAGYLSETVLPKLRKEGYKLSTNPDPNQPPLFLGLEMSRSQIGHKDPINQDGGAIVYVRIPIVWHDHGATKGWDF